jgi:hypothetical protein
MFRPTWPSSGVYDILVFIPEGICFAVFVAFVACCYIMQFLICVCFCCAAAQTRQTTRKGKKTKHAHKDIEINGNKLPNEFIKHTLIRKEQNKVNLKASREISL